MLKRLLVLRDDKLLGGRRIWLHVLGIGPTYLGGRADGDPAGDTGNVSGPLHGVLRHRVAHASGAHLSDRLWPNRTYPGHEVVESPDDARFPMELWRSSACMLDKPFPAGSPLSSVLTLGDMNPLQGKYVVRRFNEFSHNALTSHNTYALLAAVRSANRAAFGRGPLPQALADLSGLIGDLFEREEWGGTAR